MTELDSGEANRAPVLDLTTAESFARSEMTTGIDNAKRYPRSMTRFLLNAKTLATVNVEVAASCYYRLKRKNKDGAATLIEGPSIRLAEIVASSWGNMRCAARVISDDGAFIVAQGVAHDLESNLSISTEVRRRISDRNGRRYSDDMIQTTANAAISTALRNAICAVIPRAFILDVMSHAKKVAIGDAKSLDERRGNAVKSFASLGVTQAQILARLGKPSMADVDLSDVEDLLGVFNAIKDGDTKIDEEFPSAPSVRTSANTVPPTARVEVNTAVAMLRAEDPELSREFDKEFPELHKATDAVIAKALEWLKANQPKVQVKP